MNRPTVIVSALLLGLAAISPPAAARDTRTATPAKMDEVLNKLGSDAVKANMTDALSIAVVKDGKTLFYNFGSVSREKPQVPTENTIYEIASITKVFTSLILAHAVAEGKVNPQDDIRRYLPGDYPNLEFEGTPVRLIDLANTTSALPDNLPDFPKIVEKAGPDEAPFLISAALQQYTDAQLLVDLKSAALVGKPGTQSRHSNLATELLAIILEKVYGERYETLLARYVEKPFGMASGTGNARSALLATGYDKKHVVMPSLNGPSILAAGGLRYSTSDMARFLVAELAAPDAAIRLTQKPTWGDTDDMAIGYNWTLSRTIDSKLRLRTSGGAFGYSSYIEMYPDLGYGIVLFANRPGETQGQLQQLADKALEDIFGKPAVLSALESALEKGKYVNVGATVATIQRDHPELRLTESFVNQWAYRLLAEKRPQQAIGLFQYNTQQWPKSWNAFDSLAEGYEGLGDTKEAIANYRRSLELNVGNQHAVDHLKKLDPTAK